MANKSIFRRPRLFVGIIIFAVIFFVMFSFGSLPISDPFFEGLNFLNLEATFALFEITGADITLKNFIENKPLGTAGFNYNCNLKLNSILTFEGAEQIELNSQFQPINPIFQLFSVRTAEDNTIQRFLTEPRIACDVIKAVDNPSTQIDESKTGVLGDGRLPLIVSTSNLKLDVISYRADGSQVIIESRSIGKAPIIFQDEPDGFDPITNKKGIFIGNERSIGDKIITTSAEIERALSPELTLNTRLEFRVSGTVMVEVPFISDATGKTFKVVYPVRSDLIQHAINIKIPRMATQVVVPNGDDLEMSITSINPTTLKTSGSTSTSLVRVFIKLNDHGSNESNPVCTVAKTDVFGGTSAFRFGAGQAVASTTAIDRGSDGVNTLFECRLRVPNNVTPLGTYQVFAETNASNRSPTSSTFEVTRDSSPPTNGENGGNGGTSVTTKACFDCDGNMIRTVGISEMCPAFNCAGGGGTETPICSDGKPADKTASGFTCTRNGGTPPIFPSFIDCTNVMADISAGEICVPPILIFVVSNIILLGVALFIIIIVIVIIFKVIKAKSNALNLTGL